MPASVRRMPNSLGDVRAVVPQRRAAHRITGRAGGVEGVESGAVPSVRVCLGGGRHGGGQRGVQVGDQRPDRLCGRRDRVGVAVDGGRGHRLDGPRPAVHGARQVLVRVRHHRLLTPGRLPGDQAPRGRHAGETGLAQDGDAPRRRMGTLLQVRRPFDDGRVADDHRFVGLVDTHRPLGPRRPRRPGPHGEPPDPARTLTFGEQVQQRFGGTVAGQRASPPPSRCAIGVAAGPAPPSMTASRYPPGRSSSSSGSFTRLRGRPVR